MNEILNAAAELLEQNGWCQGRLQNDRGQRCALGAISAAAADYSTPEFHQAANALESILETDIVHWNDKPERTKTEVVAALRKAAQL